MVVAPAAAEMLLAVGKRRLAVEGQLMGGGDAPGIGEEAVGSRGGWWQRQRRAGLSRWQGQNYSQ